MTADPSVPSKKSSDQATTAEPTTSQATPAQASSSPAASSESSATLEQSPNQNPDQRPKKKRPAAWIIILAVGLLFVLLAGIGSYMMMRGTNSPEPAGSVSHKLSVSRQPATTVNKYQTATSTSTSQDSSDYSSGYGSGYGSGYSYDPGYGS